MAEGIESIHAESIPAYINAETAVIRMIAKLFVSV
jgi:hypothetical protein